MIDANPRTSPDSAARRGDGGGAYRISERRYGRFERAVPLPDQADRKRIDARLEDGVLQITLPKKGSAARPREKLQIHA